MARSTRILLVGLGLGASLSACAAKQGAELERYTLGMGRAEYRDYGGPAALCEAEPRWLVDELGSVNGLLSRFLTGTAQAGDAKSPRQEEHLALLGEASQSLAPVLMIHAKNLQALTRCDFRSTGAFPELARRGAELVKETQARLEEAPALVAAAELKEARRKWLEEAPAREASAKETWCAGTPVVGSGELYFAREYPNGRTEWLFCDGLMVEEAPGTEPTLFTPEWISRKDRRRIQPRKYLDAARAYPTDEIDRQPGTGMDVGSAEDADGQPRVAPGRPAEGTLGT